MYDRNIVLCDDVVELQPLSPEHAPALLEYTENEPGLWKYSLTPLRTLHDVQHFIASAEQKKIAGTDFAFAVVHKESGAIAGTTRYYEYNPLHKSVRIGHTWYGAHYHGSGINKRCKYLLLDYAFNTLECERVDFQADAENSRSRAAIESLGATLEGVLRSTAPRHIGGRRDTAIFSILRSEWISSLRQALAKKIQHRNSPGE